MDALDHQRQRLRGVRWITFYEAQEARFRGQFRARAGLHLGKHAIALMTRDHFVAIRYFDLKNFFFTRMASFPPNAMPLIPSENGYFTLRRVFLENHPILMEYIIQPEEFRHGQ